MAGLATSVVFSIVIDDMIKDDGGAEMEKILSGEGYKRGSHLRKNQKMGGVIGKTAIRQAARAAAKQVSRKAVKRLAIRGAKGLAKGALTAGMGVGAEYAL